METPQELKGIIIAFLANQKVFLGSIVQMYGGREGSPASAYRHNEPRAIKQRAATKIRSICTRSKVRWPRRVTRLRLPPQ